VHGAACGGGFALALGADVRLAGASACMNAAFIRIGLSGLRRRRELLPAPHGRGIRRRRTAAHRQLHRRAAAERLGLVSRVVPDAELTTAAEAMAADMCAIRRSVCG